MKKIPIGLSDFKKLIEGNYYYFDKTNFIDEIIKDGSEVKLFTRPRRFGKTLNMSMLKYFFDIREAEENRKLFKNLYIERIENFKEQGQYPVIFLSLKDLKATTWEEMQEKIVVTLSDFFSEYQYLLRELNENDTDKFKKEINLKNIIILGPNPDAIKWVNMVYRYNLTIKVLEDYEVFRQFLTELIFNKKYSFNTEKNGKLILTIY